MENKIKTIVELDSTQAQASIIKLGATASNTTKDIVLMRSKNCIRFVLGQCIIKDKQTPDFDQELFLKDNNRTYKLSFDCKNCFMDIQSFEK